MIFLGRVDNWEKFLIASTISVLPIGSGGKMPQPTDTRHDMFVMMVHSLPLQRSHHRAQQKDIDGYNYNYIYTTHFCISTYRVPVALKVHKYYLSIYISYATQMEEKPSFTKHR